MPLDLHAIQANVSRLTSHPQFVKWYQGSKPKDGDLVVVNNSFVFRDQSTTKARYYLVLKVGLDGRLRKDLFVAEGFRINSDFKLFPDKTPNLPALIPMQTAITQQLKTLGHVVFALIAQVEDVLRAEVPFALAPYDRIAIDPTQSAPLAITGKTIGINDPSDEDLLWSHLEKAHKAGDALSLDRLRAEFGAVLETLRTQATSKLSLPAKGKPPVNGVTDRILKVLRNHRAEYAAALRRCKGDPQVDKDAFNEVLRIAYNFAHEASTYLRLVVSICDLKPIVLWTTIAEHFALSEVLRNLPYSRSKVKASLKIYIDTVGDARNRAFHDVFPFRKALSMQLPAAAFQNSELVFFSEYGPRRTMNRLTFEDKALVDVLLEFTRARQRQVPVAFWSKNADAIEAMIALFEATNRTLKLLH
jgi:hypothetical protein